MAAVLCSFGLAPFLGRNFFPPIESTQIALHVRAATGMRIEETALQVDRIETAIRSIIPPAALHTIVDNIGLPISGINMAYSNTGTIGASDADILISLNDGQRGGRARLRQGHAGDAAAQVPRNGLRLSSGGHRDADSQLRPSGAASTCRSSARKSKTTAPTRTSCSPASLGSLALRTRASSRPSTRPRSTLTSIEPEPNSLA